jgi:hypothetical protein
MPCQLALNQHDISRAGGVCNFLDNKLENWDLLINKTEETRCKE